MLGSFFYVYVWSWLVLDASDSLIPKTMFHSSGPSRMRHLQHVNRVNSRRSVMTYDDDFYGDEQDDNELHSVG